jgi:hypothetical protein
VVIAQDPEQHCFSAVDDRCACTCGVGAVVAAGLYPAASSKAPLTLIERIVQQG